MVGQERQTERGDERETGESANPFLERHRGGFRRVPFWEALGTPPLFFPRVNIAIGMNDLQKWTYKE
jgi:hypothetical protein